MDRNLAVQQMQNYSAKIGPSVTGTLFVDDCPRCRAAKMTFDVSQAVSLQRRYDWERRYEIFCVCRNCHVSTVFVIRQRTDADAEALASHETLVTLGTALNRLFDVDGYICLKDMGVPAPPEHVPPEIANAFREGATSVITKCFNAAGAMFRLAIDLSTRPLLPPEVKPGEKEEEGLNKKVRRDLGLRLPWLFKAGRLPSDLHELSDCIREDGNDGAHQGILTKEEALDLQDFAVALLERLFTQRERLRLAEERRIKRRENTS
jgi:hypothetical protein